MMARNYFYPHHDTEMCSSICYYAIIVVVLYLMKTEVWDGSVQRVDIFQPSAPPTSLSQASPAFSVVRSDYVLFYFSGDETLHACLSFDAKRYFIRVRRDKNRLPLVKFCLTDQRQAVIKITTTLLHVKCFYPVFKKYCSNDEVNICYLIREPHHLCHQTPFHVMNHELLLAWQKHSRWIVKCLVFTVPKLNKSIECPKEQNQLQQFWSMSDFGTFLSASLVLPTRTGCFAFTECDTV